MNWIEVEARPNLPSLIPRRVAEEFEVQAGRSEIP